MRAQFVRGEDPKKSLQIGDEATYQKIAGMMQADGWTPSDPHEIDSAAGWAVEYKHHDLVKFLLDRNSAYNMTDLVQWAAQNKDIEMVELLLSYKTTPADRLGWVLSISSDNEKIHNLIKKYIREESDSHLKEDLDFERGQEPKKALDIGKNRQIKKDDTFQVYYYGVMMDVIALDNEEVGQDENFVDFIDSDGDISWAVKDRKTDKWDVHPSYKK